MTGSLGSSVFPLLDLDLDLDLGFRFGVSWMETIGFCLFLVLEPPEDAADADSSDLVNCSRVLFFYFMGSVPCLCTV